MPPDRRPRAGDAEERLPHRAEAHFETVNLDVLTLRPRGPVDAVRLAQALAGDALGIIRAKGFATALDGRKTLVQVVGHRWQTSAVEGDLEARAQGIVCLGFRGVLNRGEPGKLA